MWVDANPLEHHQIGQMRMELVDSAARQPLCWCQSRSHANPILPEILLPRVLLERSRHVLTLGHQTLPG